MITARSWLPLLQNPFSRSSSPEILLHKKRWYLHWIAKGFTALEPMLHDDPRTGKFCHGDRPGLADICLVPQVFNAVRFKVDMKRFPTIQRIHEACMKHPAFDAAQPSKQPDAEP